MQLLVHELFVFGRAHVASLSVRLGKPAWCVFPKTFTVATFHLLTLMALARGMISKGHAHSTSFPMDPKKGGIGSKKLKKFCITYELSLQ
jgi:hypothetical protein